MNTNKKLHYIFFGIGCSMLLGLQTSSTNWYRFKLAGFYQQKGKEAKVLAVHEKILRKSDVKTDNPLMLKERLSAKQKYNLAKKLADWYFKFGYKDKAIYCYEILKEADPDKVEKYLNLYALNQDVKILADIILDSENEALKDGLLPEYLKTPLWGYYYSLGLIERKRWQEAKDEFFQLVSEYPYLSSFHYCLGYVLQNLGLIEQAEEQYKITHDLNPDYIPSLDNLRVEKFNPSFDFIGIWNLDEGRGAVAKDGSGEHNNALIQGGVKWAKGISGNALEFGGVYGRVIIPDSPGIHLDGKDFTIAMWIKPALQGKFRYVYYKKGVCLCFYYTSDKVWGFLIEDSDNRYKYISITHPIDENRWYFIIQRVIQNKEHKAWLFDTENLINSSRKKDVATTTNSDGVDFVLGEKAQFKKPGAYFKGVIDEVKIFSRALTDIEIQKLYEHYINRMRAYRDL